MNHPKIKISLLLACGLVLVAPPGALAGQTGKHSAEAMFKMMDTDGDGQVSRAEFAASSKLMFTDADTNHDGVVTLAEMNASCTKMKAGMSGKADRPDKDEMNAAEMIKQHDKNGDGQLSADEQMTGCDEMFTKMDTNGDGRLSQDEYKAGRKMMKQDRKSAS